MVIGELTIFTIESLDKKEMKEEEYRKAKKRLFQKNIAPKENHGRGTQSYYANANNSRVQS